MPYRKAYSKIMETGQEITKGSCDLQISTSKTSQDYHEPTKLKVTREDDVLTSLGSRGVNICQQHHREITYYIIMLVLPKDNTR